MARNPRQRQMALARKTAHRKAIVAAKKKQNAALAVNPMMQDIALALRQGQDFYCGASSSVFSLGIGPVYFSRFLPDGLVVVAIVLIDIYCLGVKDLQTRVLSHENYESLLARLLPPTTGSLEVLPPGHGKKLVLGAVAYANALGFPPKAGFAHIKLLLDSIPDDPSAPDYTYGKDGKPFYVRGPSESLLRSKTIVHKLNAKLGSGNFEYILASGAQSEFDDVDDSIWDEEYDDEDDTEDAEDGDDVVITGNAVADRIENGRLITTIDTATVTVSTADTEKTPASAAEDHGKT